MTPHDFIFCSLGRATTGRLTYNFYCCPKPHKIIITRAILPLSALWLDWFQPWVLFCGWVTIFYPTLPKWQLDPHLHQCNHGKISVQLPKKANTFFSGGFLFEVILVNVYFHFLVTKNLPTEFTWVYRDFSSNSCVNDCIPLPPLNHTFVRLLIMASIQSMSWLHQHVTASHHVQPAPSSPWDSKSGPQRWRRHFQPSQIQLYFGWQEQHQVDWCPERCRRRARWSWDSWIGGKRSIILRGMGEKTMTGAAGIFRAIFLWGTIPSGCADIYIISCWGDHWSDASQQCSSTATHWPFTLDDIHCDSFTK